MHQRVIVALDTPNLIAAKETVTRLAKHAFAFKLGHALVLPYGLGALDDLRAAGAQRLFLDMKFHDIPSSVALGVYEATNRGVWMMTMHASGGKAMMAAAVEAAADANPEIPPILLGVTVLTSLDEAALREEVGISRPLADHAIFLAKNAIDAGMDGVVCSAHEVAAIRAQLGPDPIIVAPGIRAAGAARLDQRRTARPADALAAGANYIVVGRAVTAAEDPEKALAEFDLP